MEHNQVKCYREKVTRVTEKGLRESSYGEKGYASPTVTVDLGSIFYLVRRIGLDMIDISNLCDANGPSHP